MILPEVALAKVSASFDLSGAKCDNPTAETLILAAKKIIANNQSSELGEAFSKINFTPLDTFTSNSNPNIVFICTEYDKSTNGDFKTWEKAVRTIVSELLKSFNIPGATFYSAKSEYIQQDRSHV